MKNSVLNIFGSLVFASSVAFAQLPTSDAVKLAGHVTVVKITDDAYMVTDVDYHNSNVLVVKTADGTVVIASSPFETVNTQTMLDWIKKELKPKHMVAVNTHFHSDGSAGNDAYKRNGVEIWSSALTKVLQKKKLAKIIKTLDDDFATKELGRRAASVKIVTADHIFSNKDGKTFDFSGEKVEVFYPGPAHSPDNVVVYFPKQKILFGGCMIKPEQLGYLGDANVKAWPASARKLKKFDAKFVVQGHGPLGGADFVDKTIEVADKAAKLKK